jgi:hypothetical protein
MHVSNKRSVGPGWQRARECSRCRLRLKHLIVYSANSSLYDLRIKRFYAVEHTMFSRHREYKDRQYFLDILSSLLKLICHLRLKIRKIIWIPKNYPKSIDSSTTQFNYLYQADFKVQVIYHLNFSSNSDRN